MKLSVIIFIAIAIANSRMGFGLSVIIFIAIAIANSRMGFGLADSHVNQLPEGLRMLLKPVGEDSEGKQSIEHPRVRRYVENSQDFPLSLKGKKEISPNRVVEELLSGRGGSRLKRSAQQIDIRTLHNTVNCIPSPGYTTPEICRRFTPNSFRTTTNP